MCSGYLFSPFGGFFNGPLHRVWGVIALRRVFIKYFKFEVGKYIQVENGTFFSPSGLMGFFNGPDIEFIQFLLLVMCYLQLWFDHLNMWSDFWLPRNRDFISTFP